MENDSPCYFTRGAKLTTHVQLLVKKFGLQFQSEIGLPRGFLLELQQGKVNKVMLIRFRFSWLKNFLTRRDRMVKFKEKKWNKERKEKRIEKKEEILASSSKVVVLLTKKTVSFPLPLLYRIIKKSLFFRFTFSEWLLLTSHIPMKISTILSGPEIPI